MSHNNHSNKCICFQLPLIRKNAQSKTLTKYRISKWKMKTEQFVWQMPTFVPGLGWKQRMLEFIFMIYDVDFGMFLNFFVMNRGMFCHQIRNYYCYTNGRYTRIRIYIAYFLRNLSYCIRISLMKTIEDATSQ